MQGPNPIPCSSTVVAVPVCECVHTSTCGGEAVTDDSRYGDIFFLYQESALWLHNCMNVGYDWDLNYPLDNFYVNMKSAMDSSPIPERCFDYSGGNLFKCL